MSPDIVRSQLSQLSIVLTDLSKHVAATDESRRLAHYEIERQVQLCVDLSLAISRRLLSLRSEPIPPTSRDVFRKLGSLSIISPELAEQLAQAVGLRNLLVHEYGRLDEARFFAGLSDGYRGFVEFAGIMSAAVADM